MDKNFKVLGIGNAMVDILIHATDSFLEMHSIKKGVMQLIDLKRANYLYNDFGTEKEVSGGSGANTIVGLASLGVATCYIGKVSDDQLGNKFRIDLNNMNVNYDTNFLENQGSAETGRCIVFVTPDGERSMNTYLGVTEFLEATDIDPMKISQTEWLYLEGYRFDGQKSELAFAKAIDTAKSYGGRIALTLSDPFCIERNMQAFKNLISNGLDLLFCNELELKLLCNTKNLEIAAQYISKSVPLLACTLGEEGVLVCDRGNITLVPAEKVEPVDTTGAGDLFAAGFLYGLIHKQDPEICGKMGNLAASEIISHLGARPEINLGSLFKDKLPNFKSIG